MTVHPYLPSSPDLTPCNPRDFGLFPRTKMKLTGRRKFRRYWTPLQKQTSRNVLIALIFVMVGTAKTLLSLFHFSRFLLLSSGGDFLFTSCGGEGVSYPSSLPQWAIQYRCHYVQVYLF